MAKGSIEKRGNNSWRLTVELGYDAQGEWDFERNTIRVEDPELLRAPRRTSAHRRPALIRKGSRLGPRPSFIITGCYAASSPRRLSGEY